MRSLLSAFLLVPATTFAASIHVTRDLVPASNLPAGWQYAGCGVDTVIPRTLNKASTHAKDLTAGTCIAFCSSKGYNTAGSEYGGECYCGWTLPLPANESDCSMPCKGDATQACGGRARLSVYQNPTLTAPKANPGVDGWISYGCLADSQQNRTLPNLKPVGGPMTVALCIAGCKAAGYGFGGVEFARECWCGNSLDVEPANDPGQCSMPCVGNQTEICGGANAINVYGPPVVTPTPGPSCQPLRAEGYGLLQNGGFESNFDAWTPHINSGNWSAGIDTTHQIEGCQAAYVQPQAAPTDGYNEIVISQTLARLENGKAYRFSGYQGRLAESLDFDSPKISVFIGTKYLGTVTACKGVDGCDKAGQGGARYTLHNIPFTYGQGTGPSTISFIVRYTSTDAVMGSPALLFDAFNLVEDLTNATT